ncbi:type I restriction-modification system subunit M [Aeoliella sp. ICT_H6.2]|uniref:site-specific DNA-methyltransferase (adenine-specific) n=1 Tax=Aeoliella straminimaris TaxID=2954799 RepID=A0A9X2JET0_9BACT|nr:class I SAM-dependent DNA methyltransferase [Aeoliella straminimaris]MCO6043330.1 type I restriction-modification system subunit M [Aeoliella straminimaris]
MASNGFSDKVNFIWSVADLLRGPYKPNQYGRIILPLTVLRRLDCVLEPTKDKVLAKAASIKGGKVEREKAEPILNRAAGQSFHNTSKLTFEKLKGDPAKIAANLSQYIKSFSSTARKIIEYFGFEDEIAKLDEHDRLFLVVSKFCDIDLHPNVVPNTEMGYIFEELIRRFNEAANETAGDHFTPREVIRLMVNLLFEPDGDVLTKKGIAPTLLDPACGTGGMLAVADEYLHELNPDSRLQVFGQDHNPESYAVCGSDMLIKGHDIKNIAFGSSFSKDGFSGETFNYLLANPPFGVEWKPDEKFIRDEAERGSSGRFEAGLPRINDGSLLFLQHMISKMKPTAKGGSRIAIVFNGSPLFTGDAGSGESEIRRWIIENDWLDAIIAMPDQLFYNTGIFTYVWVVTNRKREERRGKVQLINAVDLYQKMRKSLNNKRNEISEEHIAETTRLYGEFAECDRSKIFDNQDFGFRKITVERPLKLVFQVTPERIEALREVRAFENLAKSKKKKGTKAHEAEVAAGKEYQAALVAMLESLHARTVYKNRDEFLDIITAAAKDADVKIPAPIKKAILATFSERDESADVCTDKDGNPEPDTELRDYENVPLKEDIYEYFAREVTPHVPDAWISEEKRDEKDGGVGIVGYEIPLTRHFYEYKPPRPLADIEADIADIEKDIVRMLREVVG